MNPDESPNPPPQRFRHRFKNWLLRIVRALAPSRAAWRGATVAILLLTLAIWLSVVIDATSGASVAGPLVVGAALTLVAALVAGLLILLSWIFRHTPLHFRWVFLGSALVLVLSLLTVPLGIMMPLALVAVTLSIAAIAGGAVSALVSRSWRQSNWFVRSATAFCALLGIGATIAAGLWLAGAGAPREEIVNAALSTKVPAAPASLDDPASKGSHEVKTLTYGAGNDPHRPEFAAKANLKTKPVDASKVLKGWDGITGWARTRFFGFDAKALPLNGRVWYPAGDGPFPLVLIVHGNHLASDFSDPGYEFLGLLLASRSPL